MKTTTMLDLLTEREENIRSSLRAGSVLEKNSESCAETIDMALTELLLHYNASCADKRSCQAIADGLIATARSAAALLKTGRAEKSAAARQIKSRAILLLLVAAVLCTAAAALAQKTFAGCCGCMAAAVLLAFIGGRTLFQNEEVTVRATVDPDAAWHVLRQTAETMDHKLEDLLACVEADAEKSGARRSDALSSDETKLFAGLLEALYMKNGEFALRQIAKVPEYLESRGISLVDYSPEKEHYFECFPTRREAATQRPAMLTGEKLLLMGKAIKPTE